MSARPFNESEGEKDGESTSSRCLQVKEEVARCAGATLLTTAFDSVFNLPTSRFQLIHEDC